MTSSSKRRRFQPPITTFFNPLDASSPPYGSLSPSSLILPPNELPHQIQSSLLTVGMRIRKSVPEGYKTVPKGPLSACASYNSTTPNDLIPSHRSFAELAPYCGILKTGNLAVQSMPDSAPFSMGLSMAVDDQPDSLPSSQESNSSSASMQTAQPANRNKRSQASYPDEDEEDDEEAFGSSILAREPRSVYPISHTRMPDLNTFTARVHSLNRAIAVPRARRKKFVWHGMEGQENMPVCVGDVTNGRFEFDFEDAGFLRQRNEVEGDVEMDVS
jgi:hypothetical protein